VSTIYDYFPGCSLKGTGKAYEESMLALFAALGIQVREMDDWNCCGATNYMSIDEDQALALAGRNLAIAERDGRDLIAPCAACWLVLSKTKHRLADRPDLRQAICDAIEQSCLTPAKRSGFDGTAGVRHPLEVLALDYGVEEFAAKVTHPLKGLKVVPYYGCQLVRPFAHFDDQYNPTTMDRLLAAAGCEVIDYPHKTRCCGAMQTMIMPEVGLDLVRTLVLDARDRGADLIATACPLCQFNLEANQAKASRQLKEPLEIPVLYFTQVLGLALGLGGKELGLRRSFVNVEPVLARRSADA
jgi:heterodisulfide reductase subunit B